MDDFLSRIRYSEARWPTVLMVVSAGLICIGLIPLMMEFAGGFAILIPAILLWAFACRCWWAVKPMEDWQVQLRKAWREYEALPHKEREKVRQELLEAHRRGEWGSHVL